VIWDIFLGGSSTTRPFGTAVLDGYVSPKFPRSSGRPGVSSYEAHLWRCSLYRIDMDIEGGSQTGYTAFLTALRTLMNGGNKKYVYV
jgi:chitinase